MSRAPVFYDRSGKRLHRVVAAVLVLILVVAVLVACAAPAVLAPTDPAVNADTGWARRFLTGGGTAPVIGPPDGVLSRVVSVVREHTGSGALPGPAIGEPADDAPDGPEPAGPPGPPDDWDAMDAMGLIPQDPPPGPPVKLLDAVTGQFIRYATEAEADYVGDSPYATEHYGAIPDHTLILTFDDGPDPTWTPQILSILAHERVPATFFVLGREVVRNPDLLRRIVAEGHMVGNHTYSHRDLEQESDFRSHEEIIGTDHLIRATADYGTTVFRMPYGDVDPNPVALLTGQQLGQLHVGFDLDTNDWRHPPGEAVPVPPLDGRGHVVLMHDAGGQSRAATVAMLPKLIAAARAQGYTFTTLAPILPPQHMPRHVAPTLADRAALAAAVTVTAGPIRVLTAVFWFGVSTFVMTLVYLGLSILNEWRQRRRRWPDTPDDMLPFVTVVLAAFNEGKVIERTLDALRASDYPAHRFEVVAVDDGSTDDTAAILRGYAWDRLRVLGQVNAGKSAAINNGIRHADAASTVIVTMDADTLFRAPAIRMLARHFIGHRHGRRKVGAVSGHVKVGNRRNYLTAGQSMEYINGICIIRMAEMMLNSITVVPGACSAWDRDALELIGGFSEDTLAEDADAAMTLQRCHYAVLHENAAVCDTEAPERLGPFLKQRKRWMFGNFQVMWKNRAMVFRPRYGLLGMFTLPYLIAQIVLNLLFLPLLLVVTVVAVAAGGWHYLVGFGVVVLVMQLLIAVTGVAIARERVWHLLMVPIYRLVYEVLRVYLLYSSALRVLKGAEFSWDKLERLNSVRGQA